MGLVVRPAHRDDAAALSVLYAQLVEDAGNGEAISSALAQISTDPSNQVWVGELDGVVVGTCQTVVFCSALRGLSTKGLVESVVVDLAFRRRGIATHLLAAVISELARQGVFRVYVTSRSDRSEGHKLYERLGFSEWALGFSYDPVPSN